MITAIYSQARYCLCYNNAPHRILMPKKHCWLNCFYSTLCSTEKIQILKCNIWSIFIYTTVLTLWQLIQCSVTSLNCYFLHDIIISSIVQQSIKCIKSACRVLYEISLWCHQMLANNVIMHYNSYYNAQI